MQGPEDAKAKGAPVYLAPCEIDMGSGSKGKVAYILDPDGTIVEFVEIFSTRGFRHRPSCASQILR